MKLHSTIPLLVILSAFMGSSSQSGLQPVKEEPETETDIPGYEERRTARLKNILAHEALKFARTVKTSHEAMEQLIREKETVQASRNSRALRPLRTSQGSQGSQASRLSRSPRTSQTPRALQVRHQRTQRRIVNQVKQEHQTLEEGPNNNFDLNY